MLTPEAKTRLDAERESLAAYWAGKRDRPFTLELNSDYCVCAVVWPSIWCYVGLTLRTAAMKIISLMFFSGLKVFFYRLLGVRIGRGVFIAPGVVLDPMFPQLIELEDGVLLGMGCRLFTHEYTATSFRIGRVRVGKGSVVGGYATVRSGVSIGAKVTVGFNSYVPRDVPDGQTVGGVPAKPLKTGPEVS